MASEAATSCGLVVEEISVTPAPVTGMMSTIRRTRWSKISLNRIVGGHGAGELAQHAYQLPVCCHNCHSPATPRSPCRGTEGDE